MDKRKTGSRSRFFYWSKAIYPLKNFISAWLLKLFAQLKYANK